MTYDDLFEWISYNYNLNEFRDVDQLLEKVKTDWIVQGLEFPGGNAEDSIRSDFADYQQSLPYTDPEAYARLQRNQQNQQLVADMLGNGEISRGYSDEIVSQYDNKKSEIMGIDFTNIVPNSQQYEQPAGPEVPFFLRGGFGYVYGGVKGTVEKARSQLGKIFGRKKR